MEHLPIHLPAFVWVMFVVLILFGLAVDRARRWEGLRRDRIARRRDEVALERDLLDLREAQAARREFDVYRRSAERPRPDVPAPEVGRKPR